MAPLINTTTPLKAGETYVSATETVPRAISITGSVLADQNGTLYVEQGGDGTHFDVSSSFAIVANTGQGFDIPLVDQYFRIRFTNTAGSNQTVFRLYGEARDPYGLFLQTPGAPSEGGAYAVLFYDPKIGGYRWVGRFEASEGYLANGQAAIYEKKNGKYASFLVGTATVSNETVNETSEHTPANF